MHTSLPVSRSSKLLASPFCRCLCLSHASNKRRALGQRIQAPLKLNQRWTSQSTKLIAVHVRTAQVWRWTELPWLTAPHSLLETLGCNIRSIMYMADVSSSLLETTVLTRIAIPRSPGLCLHLFLPLILLLVLDLEKRGRINRI